MSDSEENTQTMPVLQKRPRLSIPTHMEGSEEETVNNNVDALICFKISL